MNSSNILKQFIRAEKSIFHREIIVPVLKGGKIKVQIGGMILECHNNSDFSGWGIFFIKPSYKAEFIRQAEIWEKEEYRKKFSTVPLTLFTRDSHENWWALNHRKGNFVPVYLVEHLSQFDRVQAVFDGSCHWFLEEHRENDPAKTGAMRECLKRGECLENLKGYKFRPYDHKIFRLASILEEYETEDEAMKRIEKALNSGGAALLNFTENEAGYLVNWRKGYRDITSFVDKKLNIVSAGFCLSGGDRDFDLASLASLTDRRY